MNLAMAQYIEINSIGLIVLFTMFFYTLKINKDDERKSRVYFLKLLVTNIAILVYDTAIYLFRYHNSQWAMNVNYIICILFFISHSIFGYCWFMYSFSKLYPDYFVSKKAKIFLSIPCILSGILVVTSPFTKMIFYLTDNNHYVRGSFIWIVILLSSLYWLFSLVMILHEMLRPKRLCERYVYIGLLTFPIPTLLGNIVQLKFYGLSVVWICSALSLLILFINLQNHQLTRDSLTGLYNKGCTDKQISWEVSRLKDANYKLVLLVIDVDRFKNINDQYGHLIGDRALLSVADVLRKAASEKDFIGRFGGDEFVLISHIKSNQEIDELIDKINKLVDNHNKEADSYRLSLSIGKSVYEKGDVVSSHSAIAKADKDMYKNKQEKRMSI